MPSYHAGTALRDYLKPYQHTLGSWGQDWLLSLSKGLLQSRHSILSQAARAQLISTKGKQKIYRSRVDDWVKKMSNFLGKIDWDRWVLLHWKRCRKRQQRWSYIVHDGSDLAHPWAKKMEGLTKVHDGSTGAIVTGYQFVGMIGVGKEHWDITPLDCVLIHPLDEDFTCMSDVHKQRIKDMMPHLQVDHCLHIFDRGYDDEKWFAFLTEQELTWLIRLQEKRTVTFRGERHDLMAVVRTLISEGTMEEDGTIIGAATIGISHASQKKRRKNAPVGQYTLIAIDRMEYETPLILLTNHQCSNHETMVKLYLDYRQRWQIEDYFRLFKQTLSIEAMQLMKHHKLQSFLRLQMLLSDFVLQEYQKGKTPLGGGIWEALRLGGLQNRDTRIDSPYLVVEELGAWLSQEQRIPEVSTPSVPCHSQQLTMTFPDLDRM